MAVSQRAAAVAAVPVPGFNAPAGQRNTLREASSELDLPVASPALTAQAALEDQLAADLAYPEPDVGHYNGALRFAMMLGGGIGTWAVTIAGIRHLIA